MTAEQLLTLEGMRQAVADAIGAQPAAIDDDDDLIGHGIDSITVMRLAATWQRGGLPLKFAALIEKPSLRADFSFPRENVAPIPANSRRCEERRAIARPLLDLECRFEICLEPSDRAPVFR